MSNLNQYPIDTTASSLRTSNGKALEEVRQLGRLAPYVLSDHALNEARKWAAHVGCADAYAPFLNVGADAHPGSCMALFTCRGEMKNQLFAKSFGLPLRWVQGEPDFNVPRGLRNLEECIIGLFGNLAEKNSTSKGDGRWHLELAVEATGWKYFINETGLVPDELSCHSAFVPLAAAFILRAVGGRPNPKIFATGCYGTATGPCIGEVEGIDKKKQIAARLGGEEIFVPPQNFPGHQSTSDVIKISALAAPPYSPVASEGDRVRQALKPLLQRLAVPPSPMDSLEEHVAHLKAMDAWADEKEATDYYRKNIMPREIAQIRASFQSQHPERPVKYLAAVVEPKRPDVCEMLVGALGIAPENCLLFVSGGTIRDGLLAKARSITVDARHDYDELAAIFRESIKKWQIPGGVDWPRQVIFDATAGTKIMTLAMARTAEEFGATVCYLDTLKRVENRSRLPVGEKVIKLIPPPPVSGK
jgi:hypothetical protein